MNYEEFNQLNLEAKIKHLREMTPEEKAGQNIESTILLMKMNAIFPMTKFKSEYDFDRYNSLLRSWEIIEKWQPIYERLIRMKAFL